LIKKLLSCTIQNRSLIIKIFTNTFSCDPRHFSQGVKPEPVKFLFHLRFPSGFCP